MKEPCESLGERLQDAAASLEPEQPTEAEEVGLTTEASAQPDGEQLPGEDGARGTSPPRPPPVQTSLERSSASLESEGSFNTTQSIASEQLASSKSLLRRAQNRAEELRRLFQLPATEEVLDDFMCALKKKVLLQGRMYVFSEHVCFHSSLFGYHKTKVIPLSRVMEVRKRKNVGFPNSIELTLDSGKREFFTSFLAREEAYKLIMAQWRQCSENAPPTPEAEAPAETPCGRPRSVSRLLQGVSLRGMGSFTAREGNGNGNGNGSPGVRGRAPAGGLHPVHEGEEGASPTAHASGSGGPSSTSRDSLAGTGAIEVPEAALMELLQDNSFIAWPSGPLPGLTPTDGPATPGAPRPSDSTAPDNGGHGFSINGGVPLADSSVEGGSRELGLEFQALTDLQCQKELECEVACSQAAPPIPAAMQHVLEFELACPPLEFFSRFLANHSDFFQRFHAARGDKGIRLSQWQRHFKVGMVRDLQFVHPMKARIGPPQAVCHQTQRLKMFAGRHLMLETSQVMSDIPYSDSFSVETRWDVTPRGAGCAVAVHLAVPFTKKTMWRSFIEKGSHDDVLEAVQRWRQMATDTLAAAPPSGLTPAGPEPRSEAEWDALLGRVHPHYRSAVQHLRRHSRAGSISQQGGVHVGRPLPVLARHRRSASKAGGDGGAGGGRGAGSRAGSRASSSRSLGQLAEQGAKEQAALAEAHGPQPAAGELPAEEAGTAAVAPKSRLSRMLLPVVALVFGLARLLRAAARTLSCRQVAWAACLAVLAIQAAIIVQQRRELAMLYQQVGDAAPSTDGTSQQQLARAAAALGQEVAQLQGALRTLQGQLDGALGTAAALSQRLAHKAGTAP